MTRRRVAILGSTGSIGTQALEVIAAHPERFEIVGLAAGHNVALLLEQCRRFDVNRAALAEEAAAAALRVQLDVWHEVFAGPAGLLEIAANSQADVVLVATDGAVAFDAAFAAVERGIDLAVANKELIVAAGELLMPLAEQHGVRVLPVDSEHSALFQCLQGEPPERVARLILTASGGPFRTWDPERIQNATIADALAHPTWAMGVKNSIDSATLMNKGLEVIEASRLFGVPPDRIDVLVHPTSLVHGFVVFSDGNVKAQLAAPDMRLPIGYALAYPDRLDEPAVAAMRDPLHWLGGNFDTGEVALHFARVDAERFPALGLAYRALRDGGTSPCALSAANEIAVEAFHNGKIRFTWIAQIVGAVLDRVPSVALTLRSLAEIDAVARQTAHAIIEQNTGLHAVGAQAI